MASAHRNPHQPFSSKPPKFPTTTTAAAASSSSAAAGDPQNPNPSPNPAVAATTTNPLAPSEQDLFLSRATHLTRAEVLKRRKHHLKQLSKCYRDHYWALMEELKVQYREYYWKYGVSPFKDEQQNHENEPDRADEINNSKGEFDVKNNLRCAFVGCKLKAMALTRFCHLHILSDSKQKLYKACSYVIKSAQAGPITCGKPILRSTVPSLCSVHFQKAQKHVTRALKKAGLNVSSSSKLAPKFHVIVAEYVRQIQAKRRVAQRENIIKIEVKEGSAD